MTEKAMTYEEKKYLEDVAYNSKFIEICIALSASKKDYKACLHMHINA